MDATDANNRQLKYCSSMDLITNDFVSVIIPIYNQQDMIKSVIDSVLNSTYENIEIIAINDGSNDGTTNFLIILKTITRILRINVSIQS